MHLHFLKKLKSTIGNIITKAMLKKQKTDSVK